MLTMQLRSISFGLPYILQGTPPKGGRVGCAKFALHDVNIPFLSLSGVFQNHGR